jgi:hypothetical protein
MMGTLTVPGVTLGFVAPAAGAVGARRPDALSAQARPLLLPPGSTTDVSGTLHRAGVVDLTGVVLELQLLSSHGSFVDVAHTHDRCRAT